MLYPVEFARRARELTKLGVKVEILGEAEMKKLGMNVLLAVGQGSERESQLLVMRWMNGPKSQQPVAQERLVQVIKFKVKQSMSICRLFQRNRCSPNLTGALSVFKELPKTSHCVYVRENKIDGEANSHQLNHLIEAGT